MEVADDDDRDDDDDDIYDSIIIITDIINRVNNNRTIHKLESVDDDGCACAFDGVGACGGGDKNDVYDVDVGWCIFSGFEIDFDIDVVCADGVYEYMDV